MNVKSAIRGFVLGVGCLFACWTAGCDEVDENSSVTLSPESVYLSAAEVSVVTFTASGGDGDYAWSIGDTNLGELFVADETAIYKSTTNAGLNTVTVADEDGSSATAAITQD